MTYVTGRVSRPNGKGTALSLRFILDSGALYSVLPEVVWKRLRLRSSRTVEFTLADGTLISRGVSECTFTIERIAATSPVVLGRLHDAAILGIVTLETMGLMLNPLSRELMPMKMMLALAS